MGKVKEEALIQAEITQEIRASEYREDYDDSISPAHNASKQVAGNHYQMPIEPWDFIVKNNIGYLEGNVIKYVVRHKNKGGVEDLKKARHYIDKLIGEQVTPEMRKDWFYKEGWYADDATILRVYKESK